MKRLKRTCFGVLALLLVVLTAATVVEKCCGTAWTARHIYGSAWFALLWGLLALVSLVYIFRRQLSRRPMLLLLHLSLVLILAGAGITRLFGRQGTLRLRVGEERAAYDDSRGFSRDLPLRVRLDGFRIDLYPGTRAPMDYVSELTLLSGCDSLSGEVAMNRILSWRRYRFYQAAYDDDGAGATLRISHYPWVIGVPYPGYALRLIAMSGLLLGRNGTFRRLLRHPALRRGALCLLFAAIGTGAWAADMPRTLPRGAAAALGELHV